jgi:hypothetical protein
VICIDAGSRFLTALSARFGTTRFSNYQRLFFFFFFDFDAEGFQEFEILVVDFEFRIGGEGSDEGSFVGGFFALLADADGGFEDQEDVVATLFNSRDDFGDLFGIGERLVDGLAEFLHELFELLIHWVPRSLSRTEPGTGT